MINWQDIGGTIAKCKYQGRESTSEFMVLPYSGSQCIEIGCKPIEPDIQHKGVNAISWASLWRGNGLGLLTVMCAMECGNATAAVGAVTLRSKGAAPSQIIRICREPRDLDCGCTSRSLHRSIKIYCSCFGGDRELEAIGVCIGRKWVIMEQMEHFATVRAEWK